MFASFLLMTLLAEEVSGVSKASTRATSEFWNSPLSVAFQSVLRLPNTLTERDPLRDQLWKDPLFQALID
jgi:hypothetical protein